MTMATADGCLRVSTWSQVTFGLADRPVVKVSLSPKDRRRHWQEGVKFASTVWGSVQSWLTPELGVFWADSSSLSLGTNDTWGRVYPNVYSFPSDGYSSFSCDR